MNQPLIDTPDRSADAQAARFTQMAQRIILNMGSAFGGAFVIVPPKDGGDPIETLLLDSQQDVAQFWSLVKTKAEIELSRLNDQARQQSAFQRR